MKSIFITVFFETSDAEQKRLKKQVDSVGIEGFDSVDHTVSKKGYAEGINALLKKHHEDFDLFFVANPDIDISSLDNKTYLDGSKLLDIWGYAMKQSDKTYYGGIIDPLRMSGGLSIEKPHERFPKVDFVSGSLMCIKKKVIEKIGYFDDTYGMYYEDVEYCHRASKNGIAVGIDAENSYTHFEDSKTNSEKAKFLAKNRMKFLWENGSVKQKLYEVVRLPKTLLEEKGNLL
jgi:GT2 family glycosyltransferase